MKFFKKIEKYLQEVLKIKTTPHEIALGFAVGTLIAVLPTLGLGILIGMGVILIYKKMSKISLFLSFAVWNPLVLFFLYPLAYALGDILLPNVPVKNYRFEILNQVFVHSRRFLVGNFILAVTISIACYVLVFFAARYYQKHHLTEKIENVVEEIGREIKEEIVEVIIPLVEE